MTLSKEVGKGHSHFLACSSEIWFLIKPGFPVQFCTKNLCQAGQTVMNSHPLCLQIDNRYLQQSSNTENGLEGWSQEQFN